MPMCLCDEAAILRGVNTIVQQCISIDGSSLTDNPSCGGQSSTCPAAAPIVRQSPPDIQSSQKPPVLFHL